MDTENDKKMYGTRNEYTEWKTKFNSDSESKSSLQDKLTHISEQTFTHDKNRINSYIDTLQIEKENQIKQLPKITVINTNSIILKTNKQSTDAQLLLINEQLTNTNLENTQTLFNKLQQDILLQKQKQKQFNLLISEIQNKESDINNIEINDNLNKLNKKLDKYTSQYNVNETTLKLYKHIKIKKNKKQFKKLTSQINTIKEDLHFKQTIINELTNQIIHIPEVNETITRNYEQLIENQQLLKNKQVSFNILTSNINNNDDNLIQFHNLTFNTKCTCCDSNKKHYKIDQYENLKICYSEQLNTIQLSIHDLENTINELQIYKLYNENTIKNIHINSELYSEQLQYDNLKLLLDKYTLELEHSNKLINEYNKFSDIQTINKSFKIKIGSLTNQIKLINDEQNKYNSLKDELYILSKQLDYIDFTPSDFEKLNTDFIELQTIISLYNDKNKLITHLLTINQNIIFNSIQCTILDIQFKINLNKKKLTQLEITYQIENKYNLQLDKLSHSIQFLNTKITEYDTNGGFDANIIMDVQNNINVLENKKQSINNEVAVKQHELHTYYTNCKLSHKYQNELEKLHYDKKLLQTYINIIDPINGYPIKLINSYLQIFNKKVNEFVKFLGFDYQTFIKPPSDRRGNKLTITHSKNNYLFTELSGAEYFTFKLAILTSLGYLTNISPPLLIIDEGMSCLDNEHINEIPRLLTYIKKQFNHILYISHNSFLIEKADYQVKSIKLC